MNSNNNTGYVLSDEEKTTIMKSIGCIKNYVINLETVLATLQGTALKCIAIDRNLTEARIGYICKVTLQQIGKSTPILSMYQQTKMLGVELLTLQKIRRYKLQEHYIPIVTKWLEYAKELTNETNTKACATGS